MCLGEGYTFPLPLDARLGCATYFGQENVSRSDICHFQVAALRASVCFTLFSFPLCHGHKDQWYRCPISLDPSIRMAVTTQEQDSWLTLGGRKMGMGIFRMGEKYTFVV